MDKGLKPIKLDTILLRKIRACIKGNIQSISESGTGIFHVVVERHTIKKGIETKKTLFGYIIEVKPYDIKNNAKKKKNGLGNHPAGVDYER